MTTLNRTHVLPSHKNIFAKLNGRKIFSKLEVSDVYLQVQVEEECSKLLTINTHKGLYEFNQLLFGMKVMPCIFQRIIDTMMAGLDFIIAYHDDVLIKSENQRKCYEHIRKYLKE